MGYMGFKSALSLWAWLSVLKEDSTAVGVSREFSCPPRCACFGTTVDCANRGLTRLPRAVPRDTQRLDLQGNELTAVYYSDLANLSQLRILQLHENKIRTIERGAFRDLQQLERLRLDKNRIQHLPESLFENCPSLYRLELQYNSIKIIGKKLFSGLTQLRYLHLDANEISCIDENAFAGLNLLEILTLTNNNITTLWKGLLDATPRLRAFRVSGNKLICDCHLSWLAKWLVARPHLAPYMRCSSPYRLKDRLVTSVAEQEFKCKELVGGVNRECSLAPVCPRACRCGNGIVDCRDTGQTEIPGHLPEDTIELRLEHNEIRSIPSKAFAAFGLLSRIDLSNNRISDLADDSFYGLANLKSLVLYGNEIRTFSPHVFKGLSSLQLLLLNANQIQCIQRDLFQDLHSLNLLSLYDNEVQTISNGTFSPLVSITTMHLGSNPFVCDCHMAWMAEYLNQNPIETSGARCQTPARLSRKPLGKLKLDMFKCSSDLLGKYEGKCEDGSKCPRNCSCEGNRVDCSGRDLNSLPRQFPRDTTFLDLSYNQLSSLDDLIIIEGLSSLKTLDISHNRLTLLTAEDLRPFRHLSNLYLQGNHISCIPAKLIEHLSSLKDLNLSENPINCDCRISWMIDWLKTNSKSISPVCSTPSNLVGIPVVKLDKSQLQCPAGENEECLGVSYCPPECMCTESVVICSQKKLTEIPRGIPSGTTELYLHGNEIKQINPSRLQHFHSLRRLDLSNNQISILSNNTFKGLNQLSSLIISYNKLGCVERDSLIGLRNLRVLNIHGNDVSFIPDGTFRHLDKITHLAMGANPLYCDCSMEWFARWVKIGFMEPGTARCADPKPMRDKIVLTTPSSMFACTERIPDDILAKCNLCYTKPCHNGATCRSTAGRNYECLCAPGFHGSECQYKIDACYGNPCENGGICKVFETGRFACHCPSGFRGERCEENIDDCANNKCANGGTCIDGVNSYSCSCPSGYSGSFCEKRILFCTKEFNPCKNGARCTSFDAHYECHCSRGWSGVNCTENIDDCTSHLCQNGGQCVDGLDGYECKCQGEWNGPYCERGPSVLQQTEPCLKHECRHGMCIVPRGQKEYVCKCSPGYSGKYCEYLTSVTYVDKGSFVQLPPPNVKPSMNFTIRFIAPEENGVLVYHGQERRHLAVEVFSGRLRISYDVGNRPPSMMFSYELVSDKKEHIVELLLIDQNFTLRVDRGIARSMINAGDHLYLDLTEPLFLGGVPPNIAAEARRQWHLRNTTSFRGCMSRIYADGKLINLAERTKQNKVVPGCGEAEQSDEGLSIFNKEEKEIEPVSASDICENNKCGKNGECRPRIKGGYKCKCKKGWGGRYCNKTPTCTRQIQKAHVYDYGCMSPHPIKQFTCSGFCGRSCCQPKRYRKKKVTMVCNDGKKYKKDINIVKKCKCSRRCEDQQ